MKTQASNTALQSQITSGKREGLRSKILECIKFNGVGGRTILELSKKFNVPKSTITARISELQERGVIYAIKNGRYTLYVYESDALLQKLRAIEYKEMLMISWAERGLKIHGESMSYELKAELLKLIK